MARLITTMLSEISRAPAIIDPVTKHVAGRLNDLKVYPKSRAIPRSALKDVLLRLPQRVGALHLNKWLKEIKTVVNPHTGQTEVTCHFEDGSKETCDVSQVCWP